MIVAKHFLPPGIIQSNYITSRFSKKEIAITLVSTGSTSAFFPVPELVEGPGLLALSRWFRQAQPALFFRSLSWSKGRGSRFWRGLSNKKKGRPASGQPFF
jgi:hypothetical protein